MDRDNEAFELARANLRNKRLPVSNEAVTEHPTLVTAGQLFGAGKSQMGRAGSCVGPCDKGRR